MDNMKPPPRYSLSVVLPTYNEEANIEKCVSLARDTLLPEFPDLEIIIVDDGSTDRTAAIADALAARYAEVVVVHHDRNYKLGRTIRTGFARATKDLVFYTDADLPIDFADVRRGVELLARGEADVVIGYRLNRGEPWLRLVYSFVYNLLVRLIFRLKVRDVNFSYKLFKRADLCSLELTSDGSFIDAEMLAQAAAAGLRIAEIGVRYTARQAGTSTLARPGIILKIIGEMFRFWITRLIAQPSRTAKWQIDANILL